jgi:hypothetical protein
MLSESVSATVQFLKWQDLYKKERPFQMFMDLPPEVKDQRKTNVVFEDVDLLVNDMRGKEPDFELDTHGFMVTQLPPFEGRLDTATIEEFHLPAVEKLLKEKVDGADRVILFNWRVRFHFHKSFTVVLKKS